MTDEPGFFSREAGQARRRALDELLSGGMDFLLGPTGIPDRIRAAGELLNPVAAMEEASVQGGRAADPELSPEERRRAAIQSAMNVALFAVPGALAARGYMPTAQAAAETLTGMAAVPPSVEEAARLTLERLNQPGPMPETLFSNIGPEEFLRLMRAREEFLRLMRARRDAAELQRRREDMIAGGIPEAEVDRRLGIAAPRDFGFTRDNPGGDWLRNKQDRADQAMAESGRGLGRRGITGSVTGTMGMRTDMFLPTDRLSGLTGLMDENRRPGDLKFDALLARVREEGFDPNQAGNKIVIAVNHRGEPFVLEGNTRIAVARELGIPNVRAEVRYWNGAEEVEGPFSPENVARIAAREPAQ